MPSGSCICRNVKYSFTGEPAVQALCHCHECQKISGSAFTTNLLLPSSALTIAPTSTSYLKEYKTKHENGMLLTLHFCGTCGSMIYKEADAEAFKGSVVLQAGTLDQEGGMTVQDVVVGKELWTKYRVGFLEERKGAVQATEF